MPTFGGDHHPGKHGDDPRVTTLGHPMPLKSEVNLPALLWMLIELQFAKFLEHSNHGCLMRFGELLPFVSFQLSSSNVVRLALCAQLPW